MFTFVSHVFDYVTIALLEYLYALDKVAVVRQLRATKFQKIKLEFLFNLA